MCSFGRPKLHLFPRARLSPRLVCEVFVDLSTRWGGLSMPRLKHRSFPFLLAAVGILASMGGNIHIT
jgi:hypothetical protein